jgi:hypothetical protein
VLDRPHIDATTQKIQTSWRDELSIHPAAEMFPLMIPGELKVLGEDIKINGLTSPIVLWSDGKSPAVLLDGRSRLDAIEMVIGPVQVDSDGKLDWPDGGTIIIGPPVDPYAYVISANIHRRHLTAEQKRELITRLLKAQPEKSDRQIAETVKASPTTVGTARAEMEVTGELSKLDSRVGADGKSRRQPRNRARSQIYRAAKLGAEVVARLEGTSLDNARELDELVYLNRGASEGELKSPCGIWSRARCAAKK